MSSHVSAFTICALLALGACRADDDDDRESISIDQIRTGGGVPATPSPSIGPGRTAAPNRPSPGEDEDEPALPPQGISDGGAIGAFDAGASSPFGNAPTDAAVDFGGNFPDAVATPVGTPWPTPTDLAE